jgi:SAM-dependent methyltransferase
MSGTSQNAIIEAEADSPHLTPEGILKLGLGFWASKTLLSAIELGLFTELAAGPRGRDELAATLGLHPRGARDFLDALVALGMLERDGDVYSNSPESDVFLDTNKESYVGGMLEMANARLFPFWGFLTDALRTGEPQNEARNGQDFFAELYSDEGRLREFLRGMTGLSAGAAMAIAARFPFDRHSSVLDLGCAEGGLLSQLALVHPHLSGIGFDLPPVQEPFEERMRTLGLEQRVTFVGGDFFAEKLPQADVITLGHILHDWGQEEKQELLRRAYDTLPEGGAVIVFDAIIDNDRRQNAFGLLMSLNMLIETPRGFDYTAADCEGWLREAGFSDTRTEHLAGPDSMVIAIK